MTGWNNYYGYAPTAQPTVLPPQQVIRARGRESISAMRLSPNSSVLIMDETAPIVWLCVSDGLGNVTPTPYDITPHVDAPPVDVGAFEARIACLEQKMKEMSGNEEPDVKPTAK